MELTTFEHRGGDEFVAECKRVRPLTCASSVDIFLRHFESRQLDLPLISWTFNIHAATPWEVIMSAGDPRIGFHLADVPVPPPPTARPTATKSSEEEFDVEALLAEILEEHRRLGESDDDDFDAAGASDEIDPSVKVEEIGIGVEGGLDIEAALCRALDEAANLYEPPQSRVVDVSSLASDWHTSFQTTMSAFQRSRVLHPIPADRPRGGWNLSCVKLAEGRATLLHWLDFGVSGQDVVLNDRDKIVFSTPVFRPCRPIPGFEMIVPDIGVKMQKFYQPDCPEFVLRLLRVYNVANSSLLADERDGTSAGLPGACCVVCGRESNFTCSVCLFSWHAECYEPFVSHDAFSSRELALTDIPCSIGNFACGVCRPRLAVCV